MFILEYALPIAFVLFIVVFFTGLPALKSCPLEDEETVPLRSGGRLEALKARLPIILITLVYSFTAFWNLGNLKSPQSFTDMQVQSPVLRLEAEASPRTLVLFSGVGIGNYSVEYSDDGETFYALASVEQSHADVLKWHFMPIELDIMPEYVRIYCTYGNPWLGELALLDESGSAIPLSCAEAPALCDEQGTIPESQHFMNSSYFDEVYHPRTAWEHLNKVWPYEISHPPLGKILIAAGVALFGMTPFGWRFTGTLFGCLMLPVMYAFILKMFRDRKVAALGTVVFAADFMHFTQTRIATIDTYAVFFILLMYYYMYIYVSEEDNAALALSGIFFGLGAASKWTCIYAGAGLGVIWLLHWLRKFIKEEKLPWRGFWKNVGLCLVFFVLCPCIIYYLSYLPYGDSQGYQLAGRDYFNIVWDNQKFMFTYHVGVNAEHPYSSRWYQWIFNIRPILYYLEYFEDGTRSSIAAFLNPVTCWGGLMCLFVLVYTALFRKDRKAGFILLGYLAQLLPWLLVERLTFAYHYFPCSVFLVLAIAYVFNLYRLGRRDWLRWCVPAAAMAVLLFILFFPALSGKPVDNEMGSRLMGWLPTWPI